MKNRILALLGFAFALTGCNETQSSALSPDASAQQRSGNFIDSGLKAPWQKNGIAGRSIDNPSGGVGALHWAGKQYLTVQFRGKLPASLNSVWGEVSRKWEALQDPNNPTNEFLFQVVPSTYSNPKIIFEFLEDHSSPVTAKWVNYSYDPNNANLIQVHLGAQWSKNGIRLNWDDPNTLRPYLMSWTGSALGFGLSENDPTGVMHGSMDWKDGVPQGHDFFSENDVSAFNRSYNDNRASSWIPLFKYPSKTGYAYDVAVGWERARTVQGSTSNRLIPAGIVLKPDSKYSFAPMYQSGLGIWHLPVKPGTGTVITCEDKSGVAVGIGAASFGLIPFPSDKNWTTQSFTFAPQYLYGVFAPREVTGYPVSMWEAQDFLQPNTFCRRNFGAYLAFKATAMRAQ